MSWSDVQPQRFKLLKWNDEYIFGRMRTFWKVSCVMHTCMGSLSWIYPATRECLAASQNCSLMRLDQSQSKDHEPPTCLEANLHSPFPLHLSPFFCFPASRHYMNIRGKHVLSFLCVHSKRYINILTVLYLPTPLYTFSALYKIFYDNYSF